MPGQAACTAASVVSQDKTPKWSDYQGGSVTHSAASTRSPISQPDSGSDTSSVLDELRAPCSSHRSGGESEEPCLSGSDEETSRPHEFHAHYGRRMRLLGRGAYSTVHAAICKRTGKKVAIKTLPVVEHKARQAVMAECEIHRTLDHPHIVRLEAVYEVGTSLHMVLEHLEGGELLNRVVKLRGYSERRAACVMTQLLQAVGYLHARQIVHRDIKPENCLYVYRKQRHEYIKLIDFGLAARQHNGRPLVQHCGTLQYAAPEVFTGRGYDEKADMWSLGAVLYSTLLVRSPYSGDFAEIKLQNMKGWIDYCEKFGRLSRMGQSFVRALLTRDAVFRPGVLEALGHPWLHLYSESAMSAQHEVAIDFTAQRRFDVQRECPPAWPRRHVAVADWKTCIGGILLRLRGATLWKFCCGGQA